MVVRVVVLAVIVVAACAVLSRVGVVGPMGLDPPKPASGPRGSARHVSSDAGELERSWRVLGPVAMVGAAGCALIAVTTLLPDPLVMPRAVIAVCAGAALVLLVLSVATFMSWKRMNRNVLSTMECAAPDPWPLAAVLLAVFLVIALTGLGAPGGAPQARDGRYFLNNHGVLTEISSDEYERYEALRRRMLAGGIGGLYTPGFALGLYAHRRGASRDRGR